MKDTRRQSEGVETQGTAAGTETTGRKQDDPRTKDLSGATGRSVGDGAGTANRRYAVAAAGWELVGGAWAPRS